MKTTHLTGGRAARALPLAGVCAAVVTVAGYMTIGPNPDGDARASTDVRYYTAHHTHILVAGILLTYAAVLSALFGVAVWDRIRRGRLHPAVAATALVAVAVAGASDLTNAGAWYALGTMGGKDTIQPATFQTLHLAAAGSNLAAGAGFGLLLVVAGWAGLSARILPSWLALVRAAAGRGRARPDSRPGRLHRQPARPRCGCARPESPCSCAPTCPTPRAPTGGPRASRNRRSRGADDRRRESRRPCPAAACSRRHVRLKVRFGPIC